MRTASIAQEIGHLAVSRSGAVDGIEGILLQAHGIDHFRLEIGHQIIHADALFADNQHHRCTTARGEEPMDLLDQLHPAFTALLQRLPICRR